MRYVAHGILLHAEVKAPLTFCSIGGCLASVHIEVEHKGLL
jgi:hypothetical protein